MRKTAPGPPGGGRRLLRTFVGAVWGLLGGAVPPPDPGGL